ncbi:hypothetical protein [Streptomyces violaceusniger]|uniref:Uncharacterized protein n=1 Tax=Streptomyces violaceusniger TaxID=68280 RepID=A0A4D4LIA3_STRVO|nr:hypothetical protein SVIO_108170 [Streptomyces violaceusniger]
MFTASMRQARLFRVVLGLVIRLAERRLGPVVHGATGEQLLIVSADGTGLMPDGDSREDPEAVNPK